jgi:hypothetical protein
MEKLCWLYRKTFGRIKSEVNREGLTMLILLAETLVIISVVVATNG